MDNIIFSMLYLTHECEEEISNFFINDIHINKDFIQRGMHLTLYKEKQINPKFDSHKEWFHPPIQANVDETRFMLFAAGGDDPKKSKLRNYSTDKQGVGIRLTGRNNARSQIMKIRMDLANQNNSVKTSKSKNPEGIKRFHPHIKMIRKGSGLEDDLTKTGDAFRKKFTNIEFSKLEVKVLTSK